MRDDAKKRLDKLMQVDTAQLSNAAAGRVWCKRYYWKKRLEVQRERREWWGRWMNVQ